jgi:outer membrane protein assembly factor BamD (BamD/ComL family)
MSEGPSGSWDSPQQENLDNPADVHTWYTTGMELLDKGSAAAAAQVLQRAVNAEPASRSVR